MSYEIVKTISINEKQNKITLTCASNNVYPKDWFKIEYGAKQPTFEDKLGFLLQDILEGNLHLNQSANKALYLLMYNASPELLFIKNYCDNELWQFNVKYNERKERTPEEYSKIAQTLRNMLVAYYKSKYNEIKEELKNPRHIILLDGYYYVTHITPMRVRYTTNPKKAKRFTDIECDTAKAYWKYRVEAKFAD